MKKERPAKSPIKEPTPTAKPLSEMLKRAGIDRVTIIDDAADDPTVDEFGEKLQEFAALFQDGPLREQMETFGFDVTGGMPSQAALDALWKHSRKNPADELSIRTSETIFSDRRGRLAVLEQLGVALEHCKVAVQILGASAKPTNTGKLVFLDFVLNPANPNPEAAVAKVQAIYKAQDIVPLIILISDLPKLDPAHRSAVCHKVGEMGGFFGFIRKNDLIDETILCLKLAELGVGAEGETGRDSIRNYARAVAAAAKEAAKAFNSFIFELELQDYVHLQQHRLDNEGEGLGDYMQTIAEAKLGHLFSDQPEVIKSRQVLDQVRYATLLPSPTNASTALLRAFHCAQTEPPAPPRLQLRRRVNKSAAPARAPLFGDIYLSKDRLKALLVVSPACDLVVGPFWGKRQPPEPDFPVHLIEGAVMRPERKPTHDDCVICSEPLLVDEEVRIIAWQLNRTRTVRYGKLPGHFASKSYEFYARLRSIFALAVQRSFIDLIGRVGLPISPPMAERADVQLYIGKAHRELKPMGDRILGGAELRYSSKKGGTVKTEARITVEGITHVFAQLRELEKLEAAKRPVGCPPPEMIAQALMHCDFWMSSATEFAKERQGNGRQNIPALIVGPPQDSGTPVSGPFVIGVLPRAG